MASVVRDGLKLEEEANLVKADVRPQSLIPFHHSWQRHEPKRVHPHQSH